MTEPSRSDRSPSADTSFARLSVPPGEGWRDRSVHHGSRVLLLVVLALAVSLLFPPDPAPEVGRYQVGMVADEDVIATLTFGIPKAPEELERERSAAAQAVPPTFRYRPEAVSSMEEAVESFFRSLAALEELEDEEERARMLEELLQELGLLVGPVQQELLLAAPTRETLENAARRAVREILPRGVLDEAVPVEQARSPRILLVDPEGEGRYVERDSVYTTGEFYRAAVDRLPDGATSEMNELLRLTLIRFMEPSLRYDVEATEREREAARRAVPTTRATVLEGEAVVRANEQIGQRELERLQAYEEALREAGQLERMRFQALPFMGNLLLTLVILGVFGGLLYFFRQDIYHNFRWVLLQGLLVLAFAVAAAVVARQGLPAELLPVAFVALAVAVLWDGRMALILSATLAALVGVIPPFQAVHAWLPVFVAGSAAALSVRAVRRRVQWWIFIAVIAGAYLVVIGSLGLIQGWEPVRIGTSLAWAGGNAVASAILAMGFLPVFEWFTRITTDQTLLEWADMNRPLLKRLSMEAPGTYAHTINVANLAEAAANAIGANGLLARVGVYYHDVGKMLKPQYFIENQPSGRNPHDKLKPATSAAIVKEHVTEGIRLAREAKLPEILVDFIPEHHGTQEIAYFLDRARSEDGEEELDETEYRYPGPRPRSKETAIVLLADSVESATRALQDPTPERVRELIDSVVDGKIQDGQLEEAPLSLREIARIKEAFLKVLAGVYHHRVDYPSTRHLTGVREKAAPEEAEEASEEAPALVPREGDGKGRGDPEEGTP